MEAVHFEKIRMLLHLGFNYIDNPEFYDKLFQKATVYTIEKLNVSKKEIENSIFPAGRNTLNGELIYNCYSGYLTKLLKSD